MAQASDAPESAGEDEAILGLDDTDAQSPLQDSTSSRSKTRLNGK